MSRVELIMPDAEYAGFKAFVRVSDPDAQFCSCSIGEDERGENLILVDVITDHDELDWKFFEVCTMVGLPFWAP